MGKSDCQSHCEGVKVCIAPAAVKAEPTISNSQPGIVCCNIAPPIAPVITAATGARQSSAGAQEKTNPKINKVVKYAVSERITKGMLRQVNIKGAFELIGVKPSARLGRKKSAN